MEYGAIIGGVSGGIITVIGYIFVTRWLNKKTAERESRREEKEKLRVHFRDLKNEAQESFIEKTLAITSSYGKIEVTELPQPPNSFAAHFPKETTELVKYRSEIDAHNRKYEDFCLRIRNAFESENIPVGQDNPNSLSPYIYDAILQPLFHWWRERSQGKAMPHPNFKKIDTRQDAGPHNLYVSGWGSQAVAYGESENTKERCKRAILEVAENKEFQQEATKLMSSANGLVKKARTLARELGQRFADIDDFWPGTRGYEFKKTVEKCKRCKEIFG